jgi:Fe(3+) dicitrate transport protein
MKIYFFWMVSLLMALAVSANAQRFTLSGKVVDEQGDPLPYSKVYLENTSMGSETNQEGLFKLSQIPSGVYRVIVFSMGKNLYSRTVELTRENIELLISLTPLEHTMEEVAIYSTAEQTFGMSHLNAVEAFSINAAKKNEVIVLNGIHANLSTNNSREVFARVSGLNIWESDGAGLQLGIGGRGLSPNRTANFNTRQNGYDISADALGYPESYYSPPTEALERIEVVRGAASLQYGTQFGGMLNFVFKKPPSDKKFEWTSRQTAGSFGFFNTFNRVAGTAGKWSYSAFFQHKQGNGWRENSQFNAQTGFASVQFQATPKLRFSAEFTSMHYLAQQAGGLTDVLFYQNPRQSIRDRNWFQVRWNLGAFIVDYELSSSTRINTRTFGLWAGRDALGYLGQINRTDPLTDRDLLQDEYRNFGNETRLMHHYKLFGEPAAFLTGVRYYQGLTHKMQGWANDGSGPSFSFNDSELPGQSDYLFPGRNVAFFIENVFHPVPRVSITPGVRFEYIHTASDGYYMERSTDLAGNVIFEQRVDDTQERNRSLGLVGLGIGYELGESSEVYFNCSQNYRAINFNDLRVVNPNFRVDPSIHDERGFNADIGFRGQLGESFSYDLTAFYLRYNDRIGLIMKVDSSLYNIYRYRTNVADSRNVGFESVVEWNILHFLSGGKATSKWSAFSNFSIIDARYTESEESSVQGNRVELVPPMTLKTGTSFRRKGFSTSIQFAWTSSHFTDATNATFTPTAVDGEIPAYWVMDYSANYSYKQFSLYTGINNLTNNQYFTRRAAGYPGPGIIPADGRSFYLGLQIKL